MITSAKVQSILITIGNYADIFNKVTLFYLWVDAL